MMRTERELSSEEQIISDNDNLSKYDVKKLVGKGEFCDVFKAIDRESGQTVALKRLKIRQMLDGKSRFDCLREIRLLRKLDHPNIIRHIESFFANNELFIVLEYADAGDLSKMLDYFRKKQMCLNEKNVWNFFSQICTGLSYMHSKRVMHRDLKPANVLIDKGGKVKLGDLGLSAILSATTDNARSLVGTPYYMAPERLHEMEYNFKADIWSLGCLLFELVTLYPPFYEPNQNIQMLMNKIRNLNYTPITGTYCPEVSFIVNSCLVLEPHGRIDLETVYSIAKRMNERYQGPFATPARPSATTTTTLPNHSEQMMDVEDSQDTIVAAPSSSSQSSMITSDHHHHHHPNHQMMDHTAEYRARAESSSSLSEPFPHPSQNTSANAQPKMFKQIYRNLKNIF